MSERESSVRPAFEPAQQALTLYFRALAGCGCELVPYDDDADLWQHPDTATTVRLPARVAYEDAEEWYRVAVTHRSLHHALGTFGLDLAAPEPLFARRRPHLPPADVPALERFTRLFGRTALAVEVFAVLEDLRVDAAALRLFAGLAPAYQRVRHAALADRPELAVLAPRAAVAEALVRFSLGAGQVLAPATLHGPLSTVVAVAGRLADPRASVESTAEAAIRVYAVLAGLPNVGAIRTARPVRFDSLAADPAMDPDDPRLVAVTEELRLEGDEALDVRLVPVRYRDVPGPRYAGQAASGMPLQEAILRMTVDTEQSQDADTDGFAERSLQAERGGVDVTATERPPEPLPHDHGPDLDDHHEHAHGHLHPHGRDEFVYPEWDHRAGRYLADWCLVRLGSPKPVRSDRRHRRALSRHGHLLPGLVSQLERVRPAGRMLVPRQPYGDDLDLDACVDAIVDLRTGVPPSPHIYAALREERRDVAVALAIDLSSSTAERLPPDPRRPSRVERILDLQRDAVSLLVEALERVGDDYGIYGFSGGGRDDVRLSVVKDLDERRTPAMLHRLEGLTPDHTTRMGPAIRHLTARLAASEAATRVLLVVSDGRPYDLDYGQQYGDAAVLDYAVADTARALAEARDRGVRPYLVTVDPAGGDYLSEMCDPREYHVIADARDLPAALAQLYVVARGEATRATDTARSAARRAGQR
jgi:nitric oxide reductase NorD protein